MELTVDISKHLFYASWIVLIMQMFRIIGSFFLYYEIGLVIDVAFNCALILFSIGIIRLGKEIKSIRNWKISSISIIIAASVDILTLVLSYVFVDENWSLSPLIFIRLVLLIVVLICLIVGFAHLKIVIDGMEEIRLVNRKGRFFVSVGYLTQFFPAIVVWSVDRIYPDSMLAIIETIAIIVFLLASFALILGYLEIAFTMKILRDGFIEEEETELQKTNVDIEMD